MNHWIAPAASCLILASAAFAQDPHDDAPDLARHRPGVIGHDGHWHAHPGIDLSHPIITESPLPETHIRLDYSFADGDEGREHTLGATIEYAFVPEISLEVELPYTFLDPADGDEVDRFGDAAVAMKFASYRYVDHGFLPAIGLEAVLPTGNEERGIGSDHVIELEPFFRIGYWNGPFEVIGSVAVGIPLNQTSEERDEEDFALAYNLSLLYRPLPDVQLLAEFHGETVFGDEDVSEFFISPGVTFQPLEDKSISFGLGATIPVTDDKPFDYAINVMTIIHF